MVRKRGLGDQGLADKNYHQHNYIDVIKAITPDLYHDTDASIYGTGEDILYSTLGKILKVVDVIEDIFPTINYEASSLRQRFVLRNDLTNIRPYIFELKILNALNTSFSDFPNREEFKSYVSGTLLPHIVLNSPSTEFISGVSSLVTSSVNTSAKCHTYLMDTLSWYYALNSTGLTGTTVEPSSIVTEELTKLYDGSSLRESDAVTSIFEHLWKNRETVNLFNDCIPRQLSKSDYNISAGTYTSGTQNWDRLKTLVSIWYNDHDESSTTLDTYLDLFLTENTFSPKMVEDGAFTKFLQALSYGFYDINTTIEDLGDLVDIERCPPQFLQHLASLIGWRLMTGDVDRWRAQLRKAVYIYKGKGTRKALEEALELVFSDPNIVPTDQINETWEMFLPRMVYYLIATESLTLNHPKASTQTFKGIPLNRWSQANKDLNYRAATDYVLEILHQNTPPSPTRAEGGAIYFNDVKFNLSSWDPDNPNFKGFYHRQIPDCPVPPWENDRFYDNTWITRNQVEILCDILTASGNASGVNSPRGGLDIPTTYVSELSSILMKESYDNQDLYYRSWNRKWKFYASGYSPPPNLSSIAASKDVSKLGLVDYWSSKSSTITSQVYLNNFNFSVDAVRIQKSEVINSIRQVFRSFVPFHVQAKIFNVADAAEEHTSNDIQLCPIAVINAFDLSTTADVDHYILNNITPSSISLTNVVTSSTDTSANFTMSSHASTSRTSGRRRSLKYLNRFRVYSRNGKAMPIPKKAIFKVDTSAYDTLDIHTAEFIPLGYNFSSGTYFSPSGSLSGVYDASNDLAVSALPILFSGTSTYPGTETYLPAGRSDLIHSTYTYSGVNVSSTFPCRIPFLFGCAPSVGRGEIRGIKKVIIASMCRQGLTTDFGESTLDNFKFGKGIARDFANTSGVIGNSIFSGTSGVAASANEGISFTEKELKIIYSHFNDMADMNATRIGIIGSHIVDIFGTSGGSRGYAIEPYGTSDPANFGLQSSGEALTTSIGDGIMFNLSDN
jgi:phage tail-like protein